MKHCVLSLSVLLLLVFSFNPNQVFAQEEQTRRGDELSFPGNWHLYGIVGDIVWLRDMYGRFHYLAEGEGVEGIEVVQVDAKEMTVRLRDRDSGREETIVPPERGSVPVYHRGKIQGIISGQRDGFSTKIDSIRATEAPLGCLLELLSRAADFSWTTPIIGNVEMRSFHLSSVTAGEVLDLVLPAVSDEERERGFLVWSEKEGVRQESWDWAPLDLRVLTSVSVAELFSISLEAGERIVPMDSLQTVRIYASPERFGVIESRIRETEHQVVSMIEEQTGSAGEEMPPLDMVVPVLEVDNRPVGEVISLLCRFSGLNAVVGLDVPQVPITAKLKDATVREILNTILPAYALQWEFILSGRAVRITGVAPIAKSVRPPVTLRPASVIIGPAETAAEEGRGTGLETVIPLVECQADLLSDIFSTLADSSGLRFELEYPGLEKARITARISNSKVEEILNRVLPMIGCRWEEGGEDDVVRILRDKD